MRSLDELLHPITREDFKAEYEGRKPLHIPADGAGSKRALLPWAAFNAILGQTAIWNPVLMRMVRNGETIPPEIYCDSLPGRPAPRPSPAKVQTLMAEGASLIANEVQTLSPPLHDLAAVLGRTFAATIGANVYCSFGGVQAFATHYDTHDVFAIQTEGEKVWKLYANRAENPVSLPDDADLARRMMKEQRGALIQEVHMRPGDVLYLPRGWYHDALATEGASLHVTFSVMPLYGGILFRLLEPAALQDPAFRAWLAPAWQDNGATLAKQLAELGRRLQRLTELPEFVNEVAMTQEQIVERPAPYALPDRITLTRYRPTGLIPPMPAGSARIALEWALSQPEFTLEGMIGSLNFVAADVVRQVVADAERAGAFKRV
jgi:hypothetical protein